MICSNINTWILPFQRRDFFISLDDAQFEAELIKAQFRAQYIMLRSATETINPGWGIDQTEWDNDSSGQLEEAWIMFTSSEFIRKQLGIVKQANMLGSYSSGNGENRSLGVEEFEKWKETGEFLRLKAWEIALPWIAEEAQSFGYDGLVIVENNDFQTLEKEYWEKIYPAYNPIPYYPAEYYGNSFGGVYGY